MIVCVSVCTIAAGSIDVSFPLPIARYEYSIFSFIGIGSQRSPVKHAQLKQIGFIESLKCRYINPIRMAEYGCVFSTMQLPLGCVCIEHSYEYDANRMKFNYRYEVVRASGRTNAFLSIISFYLRLKPTRNSVQHA